MIKGPFSKSRPQVESTAYGFLCSVIEIVSKRGTNLRLHFDGNKEAAFGDDQQIPLLCGTKESRYLKKSLLGEYRVGGDTCHVDQTSDKRDKAIHLRAAGNSATRTLVRLSGYLLFRDLSFSCFPEANYRTLNLEPEIRWKLWHLLLPSQLYFGFATAN